jgi:hypothetical protein
MNKTINANELQSVTDKVTNEFYELPLSITPIELLGYAKNNIVEVMEINPKLSSIYADKLDLAYSLLDDVQEYLFNN